MIPKRTVIVFVVLFLTALACGPNNLTGNEDTSRATYAAQTVAAYHAQNQSPPSNPQQPPAMQPTNTQPGPQTPPTQPTNTTPPTSAIPCDQAGMVSETVPDGSEFAPGESFTKKWIVKNEGSCTWSSGYQWVFASGENMGGVTAKPLTTGTVPPGGTVEVSLDLTAPNNPGTYRGTYKIKNAGGQIFTANGFWVEIKVLTPVVGQPPVPQDPQIDFFFTITLDRTFWVDLDTATITQNGADFAYWIDINSVEHIEPLNGAEFFYWGRTNPPTFNDCWTGTLDIWPITIFNPTDVGGYFCFDTDQNRMGYLQIDDFTPGSMIFTYGIWDTP